MMITTHLDIYFMDSLLKNIEKVDINLWEYWVVLVIFST